MLKQTKDPGIVGQGTSEEGLYREVVLHICRGIPLRLLLSTALCTQETTTEPLESKLNNFLSFTPGC